MKRRSFLQFTAAALAMGTMNQRTWAGAETHQRFLWITLRGAWDALSVVSPLEDPHFLAARPALAAELQEAGPSPIQDGFYLHPTLPTVKALMASQHARAHLAVGTRYRGRSHFDGQAVLETGRTSSSVGWFNNLAHQLGASAEAVGPRMPLIARGEAPVTHQLNTRLASSSEQNLALLREWYRDEPYLTGLLQQAQALPEQTPGKMAAQATDLAQSMARDDGPALAALELSGWDTHANQQRTLTRSLEQLDEVLAALIDGLGERWQHTQIWVASEFGRTVAENGTDGTDHGTGGLALQLSGTPSLTPLTGDWPGLAPSALLDGRDLLPTTDLHAAVHQSLEAHFDQSLAPLLS